MAGASEMNYRTFVIYNIIGGVLWSVGLTALGYILGAMIPNADRYLLPLIGVIIIFSFLPPIIHILKNKNDRHAI